MLLQTQSDNKDIHELYLNYTRTQQTHNVITTSLQRRCNVTPLQRRCNDVVATLCVCWECSCDFGPECGGHEES